MRNSICLILLLSITCLCTSPEKKPGITIETKQHIAERNDNSSFIEQYIKIYGIVKYFHPDYLSGKINIDQVFIENLLPRDSSYSVRLFNERVFRILNTPGYSSFPDPDVSNDSNLDDLFTWVNDSEILDSVNKRILINITHNVNQRDKLYYVSNMTGNIGPVTLNNEVVKTDKSFPSYEFRVLAMAKYWNIINFFYPYKSQIESFNQLIKKYLQLLSHCESDIQYNLAILKLTAEIKDGHTNTRSDVLDNYFGQNYLPFICEFSGNQLYISKLSPIGKKFQTGDIVLEINEKPVDSIVKEYEQYISSANRLTIKVRLSSLVSRCRESNVTVKLLRNKDTMLINSSTITYTQHYYLSYSMLPMPSYKHNHLEYFNLYLSNSSDIRNALTHADTVIFDLRFYIKNDLMYEIAKMILPEKTKYIMVSMPDLNNPGNFQDTNDFHVGTTNPEPFGGTLIVIINENTISQAETACLIFSKYKNTIFIGRNTCGANGDVVGFELPGKITTQFSGVKVYDLNRTCTQNSGIKPDIYIERLPANIAEGTDEIFKFLNLDFK